MKAVEVLCLTPMSLPTTLRLIEANIYEDEKQNKFYKISRFPQATVLMGEQISSQKMITITPMSAYMLQINYLARQKVVYKHKIPVYLKNLNWTLFTTLNTQNDTFTINKVKVFDFLQTKVARLLYHLRKENLILTFVELNKQTPKEINAPIVTLLRGDLPSDFVNDFIEQRYHIVQKISKKIDFSEYQKQHQQISVKKLTKKIKQTLTNDKSQRPINDFFKKKNTDQK